MRDVGKSFCPPGTKRGYDDGGQDSMKRPRYDDDAALGPDGKRVHTDVSGAIPGSETVYRLLVPAKKVYIFPVFLCSSAALQSPARLLCSTMQAGVATVLFLPDAQAAFLAPFLLNKPKHFQLLWDGAEGNRTA